MTMLVHRSWTSQPLEQRQINSCCLRHPVYDTGDLLQCALVLPCFVIKVNGKLHAPNSSRVTNGPDRSGMKFWVIPLGLYQPQPIDVLAEGKGNIEQVKEEGSYKYVTIYRNKDCNFHDYLLPILLCWIIWQE